MNLNLDQRFTARTKVIASVFPIACELQRDFGPTMEGGRTKFVLDAAPKGGYATLTISDMFQKTQDTSASEASGRQVLQSFMVTVDSLAHDLIQHWAVQRIGTAAGFRPGIMIIEGETPTDQELATMNAIQRGYFEGLYQEAKDLSAKDEHKKIGEFHRAASKWLGHDEPWAANLGSSREWKTCLACYEKIDARASVCKVCRSPQDAATVSPAVPAAAPVPTLADRAKKAPLPPPVQVPAHV